MRIRTLAAVSLTILIIASSLLAQPATRPAETQPATRPASPQLPERTAELLATVAEASIRLEKFPGEVGARQHRAEALCLLGRVEESVRDFDQVNQLDRFAAPHNWQRGLALYYAGRFKDGAEQFEWHQTVNPQDVENAAWHFLCVAKSVGGEKGIAAAREKLITIRSDQRVPMMAIYQMFRGRATADDVLKAAAEGNPDAADLKERLFYGHLYIGIYEEACGNTKEAAKHIKLAATTYAEDGYMGDIARLHASK